MYKKTIPAVLLCSTSFAALAGTAGTPNTGSLFSADLGIGFLKGEAKEFVYDDQSDDKLSQLNWKIKSAPIIKGEASYEFNPIFTANINGWVTLGTGNALMDDYDWLNPNQTLWTHWSHHDDTDLNHANSIDANLRAWFLRRENGRVGASLGYKRTNQSFTAYGGCYQYANQQYVGCFPEGELSIGYKQTFETAYVGLNGEASVNQFLFQGGVKYGPWVNASDVDQHYARNLTFTESGENSRFYSANVRTAYYVTRDVNVFAEFIFDYFTNGRADTEIVDNDDGDSVFIADAAGLSSNHYIGVIGVQYKPQLDNTK